MPDRSDQYRFGSKDLLTAEALNKRVLDINSRLLGVEIEKLSEEEAFSLVLDRVLQRSESVIASLRDQLVAITELSWLTGHSSTPRTLAVEAEFFLIVEEEDRALFSPGPFAVLTRAATPNDYAVVRTLAWVRETGRWDVRVESFTGAPGPHDDWQATAIAGSTLSQLSLLTEAKADRQAVENSAEVVAIDRQAVAAAATQVEERRSDVVDLHGEVVAAASVVAGAGDAAALALANAAAAQGVVDASATILAAVPLAETARGGAQASEVAAATSAANLAGIYVVTPAGESGFVDPEGYVIFEVLADGSINNIDFAATKAQALAAARIATRLDPVIVIHPVESQTGLADPDGYVAWQLGADGVMQNVDYLDVRSIARTLREWLSAYRVQPVDDRLGAIDPDGHVSWEVGPDGVMKNLEYQQLQGRVSGLEEGTAAIGGRYQLAALLAHIITYGQSLSLGVAAGSALSTTAGLTWAKMFKGGNRSRDAAIASANYQSDFYSAFADLKEALVSSGDGYGETINYGMAEMIAQLMLAEDGVDIATSGQQLLFSNPGEGSQPISTLGPGGTYWPRVEADITNGKALADAAGAPYLVQLFNWLQGERDTLNSTTPAAYKSAHLAMKAELEAYAGGVQGVVRPIPCLSYQFSSHRTYGRDPHIAEALLALCESRSDYALTAPLYFMPHASNGAHLTAAGYRWLGGYFGIAAKRWLVDGTKPKHLQALEPIWFDQAVIQPFSVPVGRLVADTSVVSNPGNWGFSLVDDTGSAITIASVALLGVDRVIIKTSASIPSGSVLRYAWGEGLTQDGPTVGPRGCIRDQQGDALTFHSLRMDNYAPIFSKVRP